MSLPTGTIVGVAIGVLVLLGLSIASIVYLIRRRNIDQRRKVLQDSTDTFLSRASRASRLGSEKTGDMTGPGQPLLYEPIDLEASGYDYLPNPPSKAHSENAGGKLIPLRRAPSAEVHQHRESRSGEYNRSSLHELRPPALSPPGSGFSTSSGSSISSIPTPQHPNFVLPVESLSSSRKKSPPPILPPLVIPGQSKSKAPATIHNSHPPSNPPSQPAGASVTDPNSIGVPLTRSLSTFSNDTESMYSQASAFTSGTHHRAPSWAVAPQVPDIPKRFMDEYLESKSNTPNIHALGGHHRHSSINIDIDPYNNKGLRLPPPPETPLDAEEDPLSRVNTIGRLLKDRARRQEISRNDSEDGSGGASLTRNVSRIERAGSIKSINSVSATGTTPLVEEHRGNYAKRIKRVRESQMDMLEEGLTPTSTLPQSGIPSPSPLVLTPERGNAILDSRLEAYYLDGPSGLNTDASTSTGATTTTNLNSSSSDTKTSTPRPLPVPTSKTPSPTTTAVSSNQKQKTRPSLPDLTLPNPFEYLPSPSPSPSTIGTLGTTGTIGSVAALGSSAYSTYTYDPFSTEAINAYRALPIPGNSSSVTGRKADAARQGYEEGLSLDQRSLVPEVGDSSVGVVLPTPGY